MYVKIYTYVIIALLSTITCLTICWIIAMTVIICRSPDTNLGRYARYKMREILGRNLYELVYNDNVVINRDDVRLFRLFSFFSFFRSNRVNVEEEENSVSSYVSMNTNSDIEDNSSETKDAEDLRLPNVI